MSADARFRAALTGYFDTLRLRIEGDRPVRCTFCARVAPVRTMRGSDAAGHWCPRCEAEVRKEGRA